MTFVPEPRAVLDEVLEATALLHTGPSRTGDLRFGRTNVRGRLLCGFGPRDQIDAPLSEVIPPEDDDGLRGRLTEVAATGRAMLTDIVWRAAGQAVRVTLTAVPADDGVVISLAELDEAKRRRRVTNRLVHLLDVAPDLRLSIDDDDAVTAMSPLTIDQLGPVIGQPIDSLFDGPSRRRWHDQARGALAAHGLWSADLLFEPIAGYTIATQVTCARTGDVVEVLARDIDQMKEWSEHLASAVGVDAETGLANRLAALDQIEAALSRRRIGGVGPTVFSVAAEGSVMDRSSSKALGSGLAHVVDDGSFVARTGPASFSVVSEDRLDDEALRALALELRSTANEALIGDSVSVGVARGRPADRADLLLGRSDRARGVAATSGSSVFVADLV